MRIGSYNFFFHPLHKEHSASIKLISVVTNLALSILSCGFYAFIFAYVRCKEKFCDSAPSLGLDPIQSTHVKTGFVGASALKRKQKEHLDKLTQFANAGLWRHLQTHTEHIDSGFDWWMFPIDRPSSYGDLYQVTRADIEQLKKDPEFMANYREGVKLVAKSWGWDLTNGKDLTSRELCWAGWKVRLGKMLHSLRLFDQDDLRQALSSFMKAKLAGAQLEPWILQNAF